jgi:hypothetical protein
MLITTYNSALNDFMIYVDYHVIKPRAFTYYFSSVFAGQFVLRF